MKAMNLKPGDLITARYVATAATRQPAGHRSGDAVRTGSFVPVAQSTVKSAVVVMGVANLTLVTKDGSLDRQHVTPETTFEIVRNGEIL